MKDALKEYVVRIHALSVRERFILMLVLLAVIFVICDTFLLSPLGEEKKKLMTQKTQWQDKIETLAKQIEDASSRTRADPNAQVRAKLARLSLELGGLDEQIKQRAGGVIDPDQMSEMLKDLLLRETGLQLTRLQNLQGEPLLEPKESKDKNRESATPDESIYRHGLAIEFDGGYLQTLAYLRLIEKLPWNIYWGGLVFSVDEYPKAHVKITVYSLSLKADWISV